MASVTISSFGLENGTTRTMYVKWKWDKANTDHYEVKWKWANGNGWMIGNDETTTNKQSTYTAPENAKKVRVIIKPVAKKHKVNNKEVAYWTADWSKEKIYKFSSNPPITPPTPTVTIKDLFLTAEIDNYDSTATHVEFEIIKDDKSRVGSIKAVEIKTKHAALKTAAGEILAGHKYKVRCRGLKAEKGVVDLIKNLTIIDGQRSEWSDYSSDALTQPNPSDGIKTIKPITETSVSVDWVNVNNATGYEVEYTNDKRYFDSSPSNVNSITVDSVVGHCEVTGLETGNEWFFRVRSINEAGKSTWSDIKSIILGKAPAAPTTWSLSTTCAVGDDVVFNWTHNSEDNSDMSAAKLTFTVSDTDRFEITIVKKGTSTTSGHGITVEDGVRIIPYDIYMNSKEEVECDILTYISKTITIMKESSASFRIPTTSDLFKNGGQIKWSVQTKGVHDKYSDSSVERTIDVYAKPSLDMYLDTDEGRDEYGRDVLNHLPIKLVGEYAPLTQKPISYYIDVIANESYETTDAIGNRKLVMKGDSVFSKHYDISTDLNVKISAGDIYLSNNIGYTVNCTVAMDSGLTCESSLVFVVYWDDIVVEPNAYISINKENITADIVPYCEDELENMVDNVELSIYRREFDGNFVEIATGIQNGHNTMVTDPHPALDYARYRIVATSTETGAINFYDIPGIPIGEKSVIIQWGEVTEILEDVGEEENDMATWSGNILKLPFNIDVSDSIDPDVELVEYIGRKHPVSYYGTQLGETASWSVEIDKKDTETLYALRQLRIWMGDVYVREPSGSGYWANIKVSFSQKHCAMTIPVSLEIVRVEGGK